MKKDEKKFIEKITTDLIFAAGAVNLCAVEKDQDQNRVNYGMAIQSRKVLRLFGQDAEIACWEDEGFLKISKLVIGGKVIAPGYFGTFHG